MKRIAAIFIFGCILCGCVGSPKNATTQVADSGTVLVLNDSLQSAPVSDSINLGRLKAGEVVEGELSILNAGNTPFIILSVETTCGCAQIDYPKHPLKAGESGIFTYRYDSSGQTGFQIKQFTIITSLDARRHKLYILAEVD